jgi:hypothetical protein
LGFFAASSTTAMSYHRHQRTTTRYARRGLGASPDPTSTSAAAAAAATARTLSQKISGAVAPIVSIASNLVADPALPEVSCMVGQLYAIENKKPVPPCPVLPRSSRTGGIGLRKAVPAMRAWVFAEQNPWVKPVAVATVVGIPFLLGYLFGRKRA